MSNPVLYGIFGSPYVRIAEIGLAEKGVPYDLPDMAFGGNRDADYLARHPFGRIPAFEHDGFPLYETQAILRYVDEAFEGPALQPKDVRARARMNQIVGIHDAYVFPSMVAIICAQRVVAKRLGLPISEEQIAAAVPPTKTCLAALETLMGEAPYLAGDAFSLADIAMMPALAYFTMTPEGREMLPGFGRIGAWWNRVRSRPSMAATKSDFTDI